jgi:hypothetical protein
MSRQNEWNESIGIYCDNFRYFSPDKFCRGVLCYKGTTFPLSLPLFPSWDLRIPCIVGKCTSYWRVTLSKTKLCLSSFRFIILVTFRFHATCASLCLCSFYFVHFIRQRKMPLTDWISSAKGIYLPCENRFLLRFRLRGREFWNVRGEKGTEKWNRKRKTAL